MTEREHTATLAVAYLPVADLVPYVSNARTHSDDQVAQIAASIKEFGFTNPILIDGDKGIIAGHGRLQAARKLGLDTVPTIELSGLSDAQRRAYILADNKLALNAGWDTELLALELADLADLDFDLSLVGFDDDELAALLAEKTEGLTDEDDVPELQARTVSVPGDVWVLGKHRLRCGDSTSADDVADLLNGVEPHLMVTDPPYGVEYDAGWRSRAMPAKNSSGRWTEKDGRAKGAVLNDDNADWTEAWALFPGDVAYVWHGSLQTSIVLSSLEANGFKGRSLIIWAKSHFAIGRGDYHPMHEPCWYLVKDGKAGHYCGDRKQTTVWHIDKPQKSETGHSTQKPVECMRKPIENNSSPGQAVYEPFSGSGTTIIAAEETGRICYAMELSEAYVDLAVRRWQEFTGKKATHADCGSYFDDLQQERHEIAGWGEAKDGQART
jgi:DNA modification methylase